MKPHTGKYINCKYCNKSFYIPINRFETAKYCSRKCGALDVRVQIKANCLICNKIFEHISSRANKAKYCSRECYYKSRHLKGTKEYTCRHCNKKFFNPPSTKRKYCSRECINKESKANWKPSFTVARKSMLRREMINKCRKCGFDKHPEILGVHHKDGNRKNNMLSNLQVLCPNCHSILHKKHIVHGG